MFRMLSDLRAFRRDALALMEERGRSHRGLVRLHLGPKPVFLVADPETARDVLRAAADDVDKGAHIRKLARVVGWNSITMSGDRQKERRTLLHRTFAAGLSGDYVPVLGAVVRAWAVLLAREEAVELRQSTAHLTLRMICAVLFGPGVLSVGDESLLIQAVRLVEDDIADDMFRAFPAPPWVQLRKRRVIARAKAMMSLVVGRTCDRAASSSLVSALRALDLSPEELRDEVLILLLAGHHTTGAAATWMLCQMAREPQLSAAVLSEAAGLNDAAGEITAAALRSSPCSRNIALETLRLFPSSYYMARDVRRDMDIAGTKLRRGTTLIISQWHLHRDPRFWDDPEAFRTDRNHASNPAFLPFGFGPRACTGMALATLMLQITALEFASAFRAEIASPQPVPGPKPSITLVPPPIHVRLTVVEGGGSRASRAAA